MFNAPLKLESPWREFLTEIDEQLSAPVQIICIGGFVVTHVHGFSRTTGDLDHVESTRELIEELQAIAGKGSPLHKKYNLHIGPKDNADVQYLTEKYQLSFAALRKRFDDELDFIARRDWHIQTLETFWRDWFQE